ncbi:MAG: FAD-dependent oxidoreductase [Bacilli bacterium]
MHLPGEDKINGISYCAVCDGTFYKDKIVGVVGGGNSAYTNALYLSDLCSQVYIFVRNEVKADEELVNRVRNRENIVVLKNTQIMKLISENNKLEGVNLADGRELKLEGLFVAIGGKPKVDFIKNLELEKEYIKVDSKMRTSLKGVYACGDVIYKDYYQIATAINDGAIAALSIKAGD